MFILRYPCKNMAFAHLSLRIVDFPPWTEVAAQTLPGRNMLVEVWVILDRPPNDPFLRKKEPSTSSFLPASFLRRPEQLEADDVICMRCACAACSPGEQWVRKGLDISGKSNEHAVRNV